MEGSDNLKFLISKNKQKIISKENNTYFVAKFDGKYEIEVMTLKKDIKCKFKIVDITLDKIESDKIKLCDNYLNFDYTSDQKIDEEYSNSNNIIKAKRMVLCDENNDEFEIFIKDKKLEIKPFKK